MGAAAALTDALSNRPMQRSAFTAAHVSGSRSLRPLMDTLGFLIAICPPLCYINVQAAKEESDYNSSYANNQNGPFGFVHNSPMRNRIWNNLANIKFKALYTCECSKKSGFWSRTASFLLAITSATGVAAWALWQQHTTTWAFIIGGAQLLQIAIPFIPFLKHETDFLTMSFEFERLYLEYEKLWYAVEEETIEQNAAMETFYKLREREIEIEHSHKDARCPKPQRWVQKMYEETQVNLSLNFS